MRSRALQPPKPQFQVVFEERTASIIKGMRERPVIKGRGGIPFSIADFRAWFLHMLGGKYDGVVRCAYCQKFLHIGDDELQAEHMIPVAKPWYGSVGLDNLTLACRPCNIMKGRISAEGFRLLIEFLLTLPPFDRQDISTRLAAGNEGQQAMWARQRAAREQRQARLI